MRNAGIRLLLFCLFLSLFFPLFAQAEHSSVDILIFSPHPDDETLCCGETIFQAIQNNKSVKIIFLTNGDGYLRAASVWLEKNQDELTPEDYIALGQQRQKEALQAVKRLGLNKDDAIFLSYPDTGLFSLWAEDYESNYKSESIKRSFSPYEKTYNRAKKGYTKENLVSDIKDILKQYKPKRIYTSHPLDRHKDHQAATHFVNLALSELIRYDKDKWLNFVQVSYYLIHFDEANFCFSQNSSRRENAANFKQQKTEALKAYFSQSSVEKTLFDLSVKHNEIFWDVPNQKSFYLKQLQDEWEVIAKNMRQQGYNVNLAPVVDVADNIEDMDIRLAKRQRVYSQSPYAVTELASAVVKGMNKGGIIPVLKHFPGLGSTQLDTHFGLPEIQLSEKQLYKRNLLPFKNLIKKEDNSWVMINHAIYPALDSRPASLSYKIQTGLLRKKMGFKGIIIADELLNMKAMSEFARQEKIKGPFIGEITVQAFLAGTDIALIYSIPSLEGAEKIVLQIIQSVKQAIKQGRLKQRFIDDSVKRILREKEKIFTQPLRHLLKKMTLEEKICQKLVLDAYKDIEIFKKYNLGGMRARNYRFIEEAQKNAKIPMFIIAEHEGGLVKEDLLKLSTCSAYLIGREFERLAIKEECRTPEARILCLAVHPDDEDGEALIYFKEKFNCPTYILLATRGEGGESLVDSSLGKELGFLRTKEMENAASLLGVKKVFYLGKKDFGYTTSAEETFKEWGKEDTLKKLVYFYRLIKPHVIITKHNPNFAKDHGQHRAFAGLAQEAFDLAGDAQTYPEMIKDGILPWQPLKFYERAQNPYVGTQGFPSGEDIVFIDTAEIISLANKTIYQIATCALKQHRSQGKWLWREKQKPDRIFYKLIKSKVLIQGADSFLKGINLDFSLDDFGQ